MSALENTMNNSSDWSEEKYRFFVESESCVTRMDIPIARIPKLFEQINSILEFEKKKLKSSFISFGGTFALNNDPFFCSFFIKRTKICFSLILLFFSWFMNERNARDYNFLLSHFKKSKEKVFLIEKCVQFAENFIECVAGDQLIVIHLKIQQLV